MPVAPSRIWGCSFLGLSRFAAGGLGFGALNGLDLICETRQRARKGHTMAGGERSVEDPRHWKDLEEHLMGVDASEIIYDRVCEWMEQNKDDPQANFFKLSAYVSDASSPNKQNWITLCQILKYFVLTDKWTGLVKRLASIDYPICLKRIRESLPD